jgi:hypothetical protein
MVSSGLSQRNTALPFSKESAGKAPRTGLLRLRKKLLKFRDVCTDNKHEARFLSHHAGSLFSGLVTVTPSYESQPGSSFMTRVSGTPLKLHTVRADNLPEVSENHEP